MRAHNVASGYHDFAINIFFRVTTACFSEIQYNTQYCWGEKEVGPYVKAQREFNPHYPTTIIVKVILFSPLIQKTHTLSGQWCKGTTGWFRATDGAQLSVAALGMTTGKFK